MRKRLFAFLALCLLITTLPACATPRLVDVEIVDRDTGETLTNYAYRGRAYVPGVPGHRYAVRLINRTGGRILTVLSVDGVNAITGDTASTGQSGYVLSPYESTEITGWRKSSDEVAQFYFTRLPDSYAARTGRPDNVGVIGVAAFREQTRPLPMPDISLDRPRAKEAPSTPAAAPAPSDNGYAQPESRMAEKSSRLGTGHGQREYAPIEHTSFERATSSPGQVVSIRYDSPSNLSAMGVLPRPRPVYPDEPRPFPGHYVPDPY